MRAIPTLSVLTLLVATSACKKDDDTDTPFPPVITPNDTDTGSSAPPPKVYTEVRINAFIAWDAVNQEIVPPVLEGQDGYLSGYEVRLYEGPGSSTDFCRVVIDLAGLTLSPDAKNEGWVWGVDIPAGPKDGAFETCTQDGWDVDQFPEGGKVEDWMDFDWKLRFYGPLSAELEDWLTPTTPTAEFDINHYTGGDWWSDNAGISTDADSNFWYGWPMDDYRQVDRDNNAPLDARYSMVDGNGDMAQGYYVFDQRVFWDFSR